jgi:replicative DNA helicase
MTQGKPRVPPNSAEAERAVLGAILVQAGVIEQVTELLSEEDFYDPRNATVFTQAKHLAASAMPIDIVTISEALKGAGRLADAGGHAHVAELVDGYVSAANVMFHARIVRELAQLRRMIRVASEIVHRAYEPVDDIEAFVDEAEQSVFAVAQESRRRRSLRNIGDTMNEWFKELETRRDAGVRGLGVATGFGDLDRLTSGFRPGEVIIVAARPGMGKSAWALNVAENVSAEGIGVVIFSLEMAFDEIRDRFMASHARVGLARIRGGYLIDADYGKISASAGKVSDTQVWIDDSAALSAFDIRATARRLKADPRVKLGLVIVDYIQLMRPSGRHQSREQEIADISRSLKQLAKDIGVPVIALSQLNREVESRNPPIPRMADLRESGSLEQDSDTVMFLYREDYYKRGDSIRKNETDLIIAKQRNGPTGKATLSFLPDYTRFESLESNNWRPS